MAEESTTPTTSEEIDGALIDDNRIGKRLSKNVSKRTHNPNWGYTPVSKRTDDGKRWIPPPPPFRRNG